MFVNHCTLDWLQVSRACTAFTHLTQLAAMGNRIDTIVDVSYMPLALTHLDLEANPIADWSCIGPALAQLHHLQVLNLSRTRLAVIACGVNELAALEELYLRECLIDNVSCN
jgi:Leucine-rich repeat (LRR) protein